MPGPDLKAPHSFLVFAAAVAAPLAHAQTVRAVLFHAPTCPHCRQVINEDLPVFFEVYGGPPSISRGEPHRRFLSNGRLAVLFVDASHPAGGGLFEASYESHPRAGVRRSVPRMIVGDSVMTGSVEIPGRLHAILRGGLADGGISWPAIPGLDQMTAGLEPAGDQAPLTAQGPAPADSTRADTVPPTRDAAPATRADTPHTHPAPPPATVPARTTESAAFTQTAESPPAAPAPSDEMFGAIGTEPASTVGQRFRRDPIGNGLAILGLGLMVLTLAAVVAGVPRRVGPRNPGLWLPLLAAAGAGVAAYLTYVETSGATAVCGPVGDCNTVQQSEFARMFGIPVGLLGLAGYGLMIVLWVLGQEGRPTTVPARRGLVAAALIGTVVSAYLTALEPFVIGATCMWCLSSAAVMTAVLWLAAAWRGSAAVDASG